MSISKVVAAGQVPVSEPVPTVTRICEPETDTPQAIVSEVVIEHGPPPDSQLVPLKVNLIWQFLGIGVEVVTEKENFYLA